MRFGSPLARLLAGCAIAAATMAGAPAAHAESVLDQTSGGSGGSNTTVAPPFVVGQSFTAGMTGSLTRIDVLVQKYGSPGDLTLSLFATDGAGLPSGSPLTSAVMPASAFDEFSWRRRLASVPLSPAPRVAAGTRYAFVLSGGIDGNSDFYSALYSSSPYGGGERLVCRRVEACQADPGVDLSFSTYVDPGPGSDRTLWQQSQGRGHATDACAAGWGPSWMGWPNGGTGGFVCVRNSYAYAPDAPYVD